MSKDLNSGTSYDRLETALGISFSDFKLLDEALRHSSAATKGFQSYERLEFLGDRVLGLAVAELLMETFPEDSEGELARRLSYLVSAPVLTGIGQKLGLVDFIKAEESSLPKRSTSIIADVLEAIFGVIYLEQGFAVAKSKIAEIYGVRLSELTEAPKDPKSALQEFAQKHFKCLPSYKLISKEGAAHSPKFKVLVSLNNQKATAVSHSLRDAEKQAAKTLLKSLLTSESQENRS